MAEHDPRSPEDGPPSDTLDDARALSERAPVSLRLAKRYTVHDKLGEGGMGEVLDCRDVVLDRRVALKVMRADRRVASLEARFAREASVQAQLEHPAIVAVYDMGRDEAGAPFFTMRRVSGETLEQILERLRAGGDPAAERARLLGAFSQVCRAVDYAHGRGVVHRDLKPGNVMLGEFGEVYVLDWGVAKLAEQAEGEGGPTLSSPPGAKTAAGSALGTPGYMAPEQLAGEEVDGRADVFALGAVLFELLTLEPLFDERALRDRLARHGRVPDARPRARAPEAKTPPELDRICLRAAAPRRDDRYASARELAEAVDAYLAGERDASLRAEVARELVTRAASAASPQEAVRDASRALALAPDDGDALRLLLGVLRETPREEVARAAVTSEAIARLRRTQPMGALLFAAPWLTAYPLVLLLRGVQSARMAILPPVAWTLAALAMRVDHARGSQERVRYPTALVMLAVACTSVVVGPFFLLPALAATAVATHLLVGPRHTRGLVLALGCAALVVPTALVWAGILPIYEPVEGGFVLHGVFLGGARRVGIGPLLTVADLVLVLATAFFAGTFRDEIEGARRASAFTAWQLSKLLPPPPSADPPHASSASFEAAAPVAADTEVDPRAGGATTARDATEPEVMEGDALRLSGPRYETLGRSPSGPRARAWLCRDHLARRTVTILRPEPGEEEAFTRHALLLARLDHPAIPPVYDRGEDDEGPWMTTRDARGATLGDVLERLAPTEALRRRLLSALAQVSLALEYAHGRHVAHGGLDAEAIVVGEHGEVYVVDWSAARRGDGPLDPSDARARADTRALAAVLARVDAMTGAPQLTRACDAARAEHGEGRTSPRSLHDAIEALLHADRDMELRQRMAIKVTDRARAKADRAIRGDEAARAEALRDLGRAIALAPDRSEGLALLQRLLASPPKQLPEEVEAEVRMLAFETSARAAPPVAVAFALVGLLVLPAYAALAGVRDLATVAGVSLAWVLAGGVLFAGTRRGASRPRGPWASAVAMLAVAATSLIFGPHVVVPVAAVALTMGYVLGGHDAWRRQIVALGCLAILAPAGLEAFGLIGATRFVTGGGVTMVRVQGAFTPSRDTLFGGMLVANLAVVLLGAVYAIRFRDLLETIEKETQETIARLSRLLG